MAAKAKGGKGKSGSKTTSKKQIVDHLVEKTGASRKQVSAFFDGLTEIAQRDLKNGRGFQLPGLVKFKIRETRATPAGERMNPFTKQMQWFEAKPARKKVRALPLKALKDMVK